MFKKLILFTVTVVSACALPAQNLQKEGDITMLVMPAQEIPIQIGQDISRRYPVLLVSYETLRGQLALHVWDGDNWLSISTKDYANGTFFSRQPKHAVLVESEQSRIPPALIPSAAWCESANCLTSTDPRVMLHLLGLHFDFPFRHWEQFAKRYNYEIEEINPTLSNVHWWNLQGDVFLDKLAKRDVSANVESWYALEPTPVPITQVAVKKPTPVASPVTAEPVEVGATAVEITAKAPETVPEKASPEPAVQPAVEAPVKEEVSAPVIQESPVVEAVPEPKPEFIEVDPFTAEEIPAAEIVAPTEQKKAWWKLF